MKAAISSLVKSPLGVLRGAGTLLSIIIAVRSSRRRHLPAFGGGGNLISSALGSLCALLPPSLHLSLILKRRRRRRFARVCSPVSRESRNRCRRARRRRRRYLNRFCSGCLKCRVISSENKFKNRLSSGHSFGHTPCIKLVHMHRTIVAKKVLLLPRPE